MISMACDPRCETVRFVFAVFGLVQAEMKRSSSSLPQK
jgi:hypothetical protein